MPGQGPPLVEPRGDCRTRRGKIQFPMSGCGIPSRPCSNTMLPSLYGPSGMEVTCCHNLFPFCVG